MISAQNLSGIWILSVILLGPSLGSTAEISKTKVCDRLIFTEVLNPPLLEIEKRLVCGDERAAEGEAWGQIPLKQAELSLRSFLKDRGYYFPQIKTDGDALEVTLGNPTFVKKININNEVPNLNIQNDRKIIGELLTPKLLRQVNKWAFIRLQELGYPCPKATSEADAELGVLTLNLEPGHLLNLVDESRYDKKDLNGNVLHRFDAFKFGDLYDGRLVSITEQRLLQDGVFQSVHFTPECKDTGAVLQTEALTGPPHLVRLGLGVSTESLLIAKASWRNARLDKNASSIHFLGYASAIEQSLDAGLNLYEWDDSPRLSIRPLMQFKHVLRNSFEYNAFETFLGLGWTWDDQKKSFEFATGPDFQYYQELSGVGPAYSDFTNIKTLFSFRSHDFEYYAKSPRTGYSGNASILLNQAALQSTANGERIKFSGETLLNYHDYDPPLLTLGVRGMIATTITNQIYGSGINLPPPFLSYLGGSTNIRGYNLDELPKSGIGGLSEYYLGSELLLGNLSVDFKISVFPQKIIPFLFFDIGGIGTQSFVIDSPVYYSPGIGLRWASTIGPIRLTIARGYPTDTPGHFQFYFSLGEEF